MMTATASTKRLAPSSNGKTGDMQTNLTNVRITPPMLPEQKGDYNVRQMAQLDGSAVQYWEAYTESHTHTDSGVEVTQMPDIKAGDRITCDGIEYVVDWAQIDSPTSSFGKTLSMRLTTDIRL